MSTWPRCVGSGREGPSAFDGEFVRFASCHLEPSPRSGSIPVHVGGHSDIAARRAGRLGDGFFPAAGSHEDLTRLFDLARANARSAGRDPDAIEFSSGGNGAIGDGALSEVEALAAIGVDRVIVPAFLFARETPAAIEQYGAEVIARCR